jgi:hypothetical protein
VKALEVSEAVELLQSRSTKILPTAPLHSEGSQVGGTVDPQLFLGWQVDEDEKEAYKFEDKLADAFELHRKCKKSDLHTFVDDVPKFMEEVWSGIEDKNPFEDWEEDEDGDEDIEDLDDEDDERAESRRTFIEAECMTVLLTEKGIPCQYFERDDTGYDSYDEYAGAVIIGERLLKNTGPELIEEIQKAQEKLEGLREKIPFKLGEIKVIIDGNESHGMTSG